MTSAPYFLATIFLEKNENNLKLLMKRAIFLTVVSTTIFVIFPMKFYFPKPEIANPIFKILFHIISFLYCIYKFYFSTKNFFKYTKYYKTIQYQNLNTNLNL